MEAEFRTCYGFSMWAPRGHWGPEGRMIHVTQTRIPLFAYTLCGQKVSRMMDIFSPPEATCRECKRRWELAAQRTIDVRER